MFGDGNPPLAAILHGHDVNAWPLALADDGDGLGDGRGRGDMAAWLDTAVMLPNFMDLVHGLLLHGDG